MSQRPQVGRGRRRTLDRVWIIVADGGRARMLGITGDRRGLTVLRELVSVDARRRTRELVSDRPSRGGVANAPATNHALTLRDDAQEAVQQRFIGQLGLMLIEDNRARQFDELILVVPPDLTGPLRDALDEPTRARLRETLVADFTRMALDDIHDRLVEAGLLPAPVQVA